MSAIARWMARHLYFWCLWIAKHPAVHRIQRHMMGRMTPEKRRKAELNLYRQNRFARRIGLPMLTVMMNLILASIIISVVFRASLALFESGILTPPDKIKKAADDRGQ